MASFIDLFSGAGGLTLGLSRAGWTPLLGVDHWSDAVATYRKNFAGHQIISCDIELLEVADLIRAAPALPEWVVGGPPCQGFSTVGKRKRDDSRNKLVREFKRVVEAIRPEGFIIENVLGLKDMRFEHSIKELFSEIGYAVSFHVMRAADHGVPQLRRRVLFVGHRERGAFGGLLPTHAEADYVTVGDAISDLPRVRPGEAATRYDGPAVSDYQRAMRAGSTDVQGHIASNHPAYLIEAISHIPDGGNRRSIPDSLQPRSGFHNSYARLASWLPAMAVTSNMGKPSASRCIHPFQDRGLTAREGARLQGFPDTFHFTGGITSQRLQVANAVPPLLAQRIGEALLDDARWEGAAAETVVAA